MVIDLYTIYKSKNSTTRPASSGVEYECVLKDGTSISNPIVILSSIDKPTSLNYSYIPEFQRYYFVEDWTYDRGFWVATLSIDVLATWRNTIGRSSQFIERSGRAGEVVDSFYPLKSTPEITEFNMNNILADTQLHPIGSGVFVVKILGNPNVLYSDTGINTYVMTNAQFILFRQELSTTEYTDIDAEIDGLSENVAKLITNPFQYVISCVYYPISFETLTAAGMPSVLSPITYGWYSLTNEAYYIGDFPLVKLSLYRGAVPVHPYYTISENTGRNYKQYFSEYYSKYDIVYPLIGSLTIPNTLMYHGVDGLIDIFITLDLFSNSCTVQAISIDAEGTPMSEDVLGLTSIGIDIPISSITREATAIVDLASNAWKNALQLDIVGGVKDVINDASSLFKADVNVSGEMGGFSGMVLTPRLRLTSMIPCINANYTPKCGMATCEVHTINQCTKPHEAETENSIIICKNAAISTHISGEAYWYSAEYDTIISFMESGFYYV